jgi:arginine utilization protein RocB
MEYSINLLTTVEQCDALLTSLNQESEEQDFRKTSQQRKIEDDFSSTEDLPAQIEALNTQIATFNTLIADMEESEDKDDMLDELGLMENELIDLNQRLETKGIQARLIKELDFNFLERMIAVNDGLKPITETRKSELPA